MTYVVDASVAVKWVLPEALTESATRLLDLGDDLIAPELLVVDAANALWQKTARRELTSAEAARVFSVLVASVVELRPVRPLAARALELASVLDHPVYDCVYLSLAERERATLVSADRRFLAAIARRRFKIAVRALSDF